MKNQRKWFNGLAALLLVGQVAISATGTFAQSMLNDKTSHAATVSKDFYFQDGQGKRVSSIDSRENSTNTIYIKDTNAKDTSVTIDLPAGIDFDQMKTDKLIESEKSSGSGKDTVKVSYNDNTRKVTIDFLAAKEAINNVVTKKQAVSQAQAALLSLKNNDKNKSEVQVEISDKQAEVKKAQQALAEAQTEVSNTEKIAGMIFTKKSKTDEVLKAKTVRDNTEVESESLNIREPKTDKQTESTATTESTDDSASDANVADQKNTFEGKAGEDIPDTLADGTAIPAPPASNVDISKYFTIPSGASDAYFSSKYHQAAIITDNVEQQHGGIWGKNTVDLSRDFDTEMYVYMMNDGSEPADGIAFVLQGDSRGDQAIGQLGSGLGVYGESGKTDNPTVVGGIQNALAVEFDPFYNYARGNNDPTANSREEGVVNPDPGNSSTGQHTAVLSSNLDIQDRLDDKTNSWWTFQTHHNVEQRTDLVQNKWQKFSVKWDAARQNLTYTYGSGAQQSYHVPDIQATFGGNIVTYGYTGSTGAKYEHQYVSFDKLPQNSAVHVKYKDIDTGKDIIDPVDLSGEVGQNYTTEQKDFSSQSYTYVKVDKDGTVVPSPVSGTFTENEQTVTYWYKREAASPVVEKSVKDLSNGNDLNKVRVGDTLEYTITATNKGKGYWNNVVVTDTIPEGLDDIDTSKVVATLPDGSTVPVSDITYDKTSRNLVIKNIGNLKPGESVKIVFPAIVNGDAVGKSIANVAMADGENPDGSTTGGSDDETVTPPDYKDPKPEVKKTVENLSGSKDVNDVHVGDTLEYTIDTTNVTENSILKNIVVSDKIPSGLDLDETSVKAYGPDGNEITGAQVSYKNGQLVVSGLGDLKYDGHIKVVFQAKVNKDAIGKNIVNIADVTGENPDGSTTGGNGTDSTPVPDYNDPKSEVKKSVKDLTNGNDLNKVRVGDDLEYTIDTTNTAKDSILKNVVVSDNIPEGLDLDETSVKAYGPDGNEITGAQVSYENGQLVVSGLGDLKYNEHIKVVFTAMVNEKAVGNVIENIADVTGENPDGSTTGGNGTDSTPVPDYNDPKPEVKKSVKDLSNNNDLDKVRVGDTLQYTITATNTAKDSIWKNVVVNDQLPSELDFNNDVKVYLDGKDITNKVTVGYSNGVLKVMNIGDLKYNQQVKVVFTEQVTSRATGKKVVNIADVTGDNPDGSVTGDHDSTVTPQNPSKPGNPNDPGNSGLNGGNGSGKTGLLPQTGEARDAMLVIIGLIVLSTVSLIVYFKKRSKQTM